MNGTYLIDINTNLIFHKVLSNEIVNRVTGDKLRFLPTANETDSVKIEFTLPPRAAGAPLHYHLKFTEIFTVLDGRLQMTVGATKQTLQPGETLEVKPGTVHGFSNPHDAPVTFTTENLPAAEFEKFIRTMFGLANDGKTHRSGMPINPLHLALALDFADLYFPLVPAWMQRVARKALRRLAAVTGAENELTKYFAANV